jgi:hypothetical protein
VPAPTSKPVVTLPPSVASAPAPTAKALNDEIPF